MRLHILSDLHLEFGKMPRSYTPPGCDVIILAGDIATGVVGVMWAAETFRVPVIYIPGNHEFYGKRIYAEHLGKMVAKAAGTQVMVLNNAQVSIDGVRFLGATLWTDFDLYGTRPISERLAQDSMNDFRQIFSKDRTPLTAADAVQLHRESRFFLSEHLRDGSGAKTVVVTHHAPSEMSSAPRYRGDPLTPSYASRLESLILDTSPVLWAHGHMHDTADYRLGETRIVCNPRGYHGHELNPTFDPGLVVEI